MRAGDLVRTEIELPGIPIGSRGVVREVGRVFAVIVFDEGRRGYYTRRQLSVLSGAAGDPPAASSVALGIGEAKVPRGSHLCLLPSSRKAALSTLASYVAAGVRSGEMAVGAMPARWSLALMEELSKVGVDGRAAVHEGRLRCVPLSRVYLGQAGFSASEQLELQASRLSQMLRMSRGGVRCFGIVRDQHLAQGWWDYEDRMTPLLKHLGVVALCTYWGRRVDRTVRHMAVRCHTHVLEDEALTRGGAAA